MAGLWVNECGNALDVQLSAGVGGLKAFCRCRNDDLRLQGVYSSVADDECWCIAGEEQRATGSVSRATKAARGRYR